MHYVHDKNESLLSKFLKLVFSLLGWKHSMEKDLAQGNIDQAVAPLPRSLSKGFRVEVDEINGRNIWTIRPKQNGSVKTLLYFHGGAYIHNIQKVHWQLIEKLIHETGVTVIVPDYPLAPQSTCVQTFSFMHSVYDTVLERFAPGDLSFIGDSAGGGLALALSQSLRNDGRPLPQQLILLSPWLDIGMDNPEIPSLDQFDKILGVRGLQMAGESYAGDLDPRDYRVSPLYGNFDQLPKMSIFIGTHDLLLGDSRRLNTLLEAKGVSYNFFEYPKMMHVWTVIPALEEAKHSISQIVKVIENKLHKDR